MLAAMGVGGTEGMETFYDTCLAVRPYPPRAPGSRIARLTRAVRAADALPARILRGGLTAAAAGVPRPDSEDCTEHGALPADGGAERLLQSAVQKPITNILAPTT